MFNFLDAIPVVGHIKGVVHYASGDVDAGNRAMLQSTRSTTVIGAGAVGFVAGPVGSAALGASAGALWDCAESVATDKPQGLIKDIGNIVDTAAKGEVPVAGVIQTVITVGGDALGGLGGGSMANSVTKSVGQSAAKSAGQSAAKSVGKSVGKSTGEQILKSASVPAGETFGKSVAQSAGKSVAETAGKSVARSAGKSVAQEAGKSVAKSAGKSATKSAVKAAVIEVVEDAAEVVVTQALIKSAKENVDAIQQAANDAGPKKPPSNGSSGGSTPSSTSATRTIRTGTSANETGAAGGSGKPPEQNPKQTCSGTVDTEGSPWDEFFELFNVRSLGRIAIEGVRLFEKLEDHQIIYLETLLKKILDKKLLATVVKILLKMMKNMKKGEINFLNFISLCEFIMQYLEEHMKRLQQQQGNAPGTFPRTIEDVIDSINSSSHLHDSILNLFNQLLTQIRRHTLLISFRDDFCAVYHYFKHRLVGTRELSILEYYDLINTNLPIIMATGEYQTLVNRGRPPVRYMRFYRVHGTRLLIVIKEQGGKIVVSTAFFRDKPCKGDNEGDKYINNRKM